MIKPQFQNKANSSVFLWLNNLLAQKGSGFYNAGSRFYPVTNELANLYTYSSPYSQFISDSSISGASVPTGIYVNNNFVGTGTSGFFGYNYEKGKAYFTSALPASAIVSGSFSLKDFNISLTSVPEEQLLFETKLSLRPKTSTVITGQATDELSYPAIFIKSNGYKNEAFALGGTDLSKIDYSLVIFADSKYQVDAVESLLCDAKHTYMPLFDTSDMPYDSYGRCKSGNYNYQTVKINKPAGGSQSLWIESINKPTFNQMIYEDLKKINPEAFVSIIKLTVCAARNPRG